MAITQYEENGVSYFKVYVHLRSRTNRNIRIQKYARLLKSETEARKVEKKLIKEASIELQKKDGKGLLWNDILHLWTLDLEAGYICKVNERSAQGYISILKKWTKDWNYRQASQLSRADGRRILQLMDGANLSKRYQKKAKNIINKVFEWGVEYGYILGNTVPPMKGLLIDSKNEKAPDILSLEDIKKFLNAAKAVGHNWYPVWAFAVLTGMRSGEMHALSWGQVDLEKGTILVDRAYDANLKKIGPTKGRYWRTVPINHSLRGLLLDLKNKKTPSEESFVLPRSKEWDHGDQAAVLKNFLRSINVRPIKFHALRACFATQMLANGVSSPVVMKIGGWKKSATMDIYLRLAGVDTKGATDCLKFSPDNISFGENIVRLADRKKDH